MYLDQVLTFFSLGGYSSNDKYQYSVAKETKKVSKRNAHIFPMNGAALKKIDDCYWQAMQDLLLQRMMKYQFFPQSIDEKIGNCIIFGTGKYGRLCYTLLEYCHVNTLCFLDNDEKKQGQLFGRVVTGPNKIKQMKFDLVIISVLDHEKEIYKQLRALGVKDIKIKLFSKLKSTIVREYVSRVYSNR